MAFDFSFERATNTATLTLFSCRGAHTQGVVSCGCSKPEVQSYRQVMVLEYTTPVTRCVLETMFRKGSLMTNIADEISVFFKTHPDSTASAIDLWKEYLLRDLELNRTWKRCPKCSGPGTAIHFDDIHYIVPELDACAKCVPRPERECKTK